MINSNKKISLFLQLIACFLISFRGFSQQKSTAIVEHIFQKPTQQYGIRCWWWWLNGNVTKEAITRDLEEMKAKGFSGACIFDAGGYNQRGNGDVPEGPMFGSKAWRVLYVHAIKEANRLGLVMSLSIQSGWNLGGPDITTTEAAKQVISSETPIVGGKLVDITLAQPNIKEDFYREIAVLAIPNKGIKNRKPIRDFENKAATREVGWSVPETRPLLIDIPATEGEEDAQKKEVINVSQWVKNGKLLWNAPKGNWLILRMGYTVTGAEVSTASGKWQGRVIDYTSAKHFNRYWDTNVEPLLKMIGPMAGKTLRYLQTDSFEAGGMNWSDGFEHEFRKRRGYDPVPYLPVLAGKIIESREASNNFLNDLRKTLSDCISDNHYRVFALRAKKYGIGIQPESAGPHAGPFDGLKNYGHSEIMMSEFWSPSPHRSKDVDRFFVKQAASAAKIYNKKLVGAESFTTIGPHWNDVIWADMKPSADHEFCAGLNLIYLHTFTCSPKEMGLPGQEYFAGTHFNPNVTWWNYSTAFVQYLSRCHYMMQEGRTVADVLYYYGDHAPNLARYKADDPAGALPEYDYDVINEDRLLVLSVKDGKIMLPHGDSYNVLVLPNHRILSLAALKKVQQLLLQGATIIGTKSLSTASLVSYPNAELERAKIVQQIWGDGESATGEKQYGKGTIVWGKKAKEVLKSKNILADCEWINKEAGQNFDYIHRKSGAIDYYFISSQNKEKAQVTAKFRIGDKLPEFWDAVTGEISPVKEYTVADGQISIPLQFNPNGSIFVVFRKKLTSKEHQSGANFTNYEVTQTLDKPWQVYFDPKWGGTNWITFDKLYDWTSRSEEGIKYYSGTAIYKTQFDAENEQDEIALDLGEVKDVGIAKVKLNGKDLGILWCPPFRVAVKGLLKKTGNELEIEVVNTWRNRLIGDREKPANERYTQTNITIKPDWKLMPSGLLGPVQLMKEK
ncbi:glycosyl hydrolase [Arcicella aquatica]|uniref:Glycosyl hydrolase n=1 Tax=Arcicella aquatica TaxID=217141 RepID=A0ABU5QI05_9BACT|nr:glycosyl hydrolase [Arcicella aquatica]MEA5256687.1 glycosyl hydrolase [Arcicella aquatica]